jgi:CMP-2-keto-3-deoxyoctulosonic acid synthetase
MTVLNIIQGGISTQVGSAEYVTATGHVVTTRPDSFVEIKVIEYTGMINPRLILKAMDDIATSDECLEELVNRINGAIALVINGHGDTTIIKLSLIKKVAEVLKENKKTDLLSSLITNCMAAGYSKFEEG